VPSSSPCSRGALYISNKGFGPPQPGEILRVSIPGVTSSSAVAAR